MRSQLRSVVATLLISARLCAHNIDYAVTNRAMCRRGFAAATAPAIACTCTGYSSSAADEGTLSSILEARPADVRRLATDEKAVKRWCSPPDWLIVRLWRPRLTATLTFCRGSGASRGPGSTVFGSQAVAFVQSPSSLVREWARFWQSQTSALRLTISCSVTTETRRITATMTSKLLRPFGLTQHRSRLSSCRRRAALLLTQLLPSAAVLGASALRLLWLHAVARAIRRSGSLRSTPANRPVLLTTTLQTELSPLQRASKYCQRFNRASTYSRIPRRYTSVIQFDRLADDKRVRKRLRVAVFEPPRTPFDDEFQLAAPVPAAVYDYSFLLRRLTTRDSDTISDGGSDIL